MTPAELKAARAKLGLTQAQLASVMDLDPPTVSRIERGVRSPPVRYVRLLQAYMNHYKPPDWPG